MQCTDTVELPSCAWPGPAHPRSGLERQQRGALAACEMRRERRQLRIKRAQLAAQRGRKGRLRGRGRGWRGMRVLGARGEGRCGPPADLLQAARCVTARCL